MTAYKILTHDYRPPLQGGQPAAAGVAVWVCQSVELSEPEDRARALPGGTAAGLSSALGLSPSGSLSSTVNADALGVEAVSHHKEMRS